MREVIGERDGARAGADRGFFECVPFDVATFENVSTSPSLRVGASASKAAAVFEILRERIEYRTARRANPLDDRPTSTRDETVDERILPNEARIRYFSR